MKILQVITGLQKAAGTSVFCGEISNQLVSRGHEVSVAICDLTEANKYPLDARVHLVSIDDVIRSSNLSYDLVHIHALWSPILHRVSRWAEARAIPVVWSPHGMLTPWAMRNKRLKKLLGWHLYQKHDLKSAALLHATAPSEVEDFRRLGLANSVLVAPLGVEQKVCEKIAREERTLLFVSRVQRKKGLPMLLEAWAKLENELKQGWTVRIVGPDQDNHTAELQAQSEKLRITRDFIFAGAKYDDELAAEYANADLFILPTHSENFGSVVIEALAQGVPVITTKQAPWAELQEFQCGWWVEDTVEALTAALREALRRTDLGEMGARGQKLVAERYTWSAVCDKIIGGYQSVTKGCSL